MNDEEMTSLYMDLAAERVDDVRAKLEGGLAPDTMIRLDASRKLRPLIVAAAANNAQQMVALLIEHGADVNLRSEEGYTALMLAAREKHRAVVSALVDAGADLEAKGPEGQTAAQMTRAKSIKSILALEGWDGEEDGEDGDDDGEGSSEGPREMTVAALERWHDRELPAGFRRFVETKAWLPVEGKKFPMPSYRDGVEVRFAHVCGDGTLEAPGLLADAGDHDEDAARDLIPFAAIYLDDDYRDAQFLLVDASTDDGPVMMFEHETGEFEHVADSIDAFLATVGQSLPAEEDDDEDDDEGGDDGDGDGDEDGEEE